MRNWQFSKQFVTARIMIKSHYYVLAYNAGKIPYVLRRCFSFFMLALLTTKQPVERALKIVQYTKVSKKLYEIRNEELKV